MWTGEAKPRGDRESEPSTAFLLTGNIAQRGEVLCVRGYRQQEVIS